MHSVRALYSSSERDCPSLPFCHRGVLEGRPWHWSSAGVSTVAVRCTLPLSETLWHCTHPTALKRSCAHISLARPPSTLLRRVRRALRSIRRSWCWCDARHTRGTWRALASVGEIGPPCRDRLARESERASMVLRLSVGIVRVDEVCGRWTRRAVPSAVRWETPIAGGVGHGGFVGGRGEADGVRWACDV